MCIRGSHSLVKPSPVDRPLPVATLLTYDFRDVLNFIKAITSNTCLECRVFLFWSFNWFFFIGLGNIRVLCGPDILQFFQVSFLYFDIAQFLSLFISTLMLNAHIWIRKFFIDFYYILYCIYIDFNCWKCIYFDLL